MPTGYQHYQRLWKGVTNTSDEGKAIRTLADILLDKEGRTFISNLERKDAGLCIEILDLVSPDLCFRFPLSPSQTLSSGPRKAQPQNYRETRFLHRAEETCCNSWAIARIRDDSRGD